MRGEISVKISKLITEYVKSARLISWKLRFSDAIIEPRIVKATTPGTIKYKANKTVSVLRLISDFQLSLLIV